MDTGIDTGERPAYAASRTDPLAVTRMLQHGLELVDDLSGKLQRLDSLMLTARPHEISEAAIDVETALKSASPTFSSIAASMEQLGAYNLQSFADYYRDAEHNNAATLAETLRLALARFAKRSVSANRRAQHLNRGLNAALATLQAVGVQETGRLIAEA